MCMTNADQLSGLTRREKECWVHVHETIIAAGGLAGIGLPDNRPGRGEAAIRVT